MEKRNDLPKIIWFLWWQGYDNAPLVVQHCYASWKRNNPGWEMKFLDEKNIYEYFDLTSLIGKACQDIRKCQLSEIIRINLLQKYGGIWVDATCFCCFSLDLWIYEYIGSGFFAFDRPGRSRMIASWFLAATKDNYIVKMYAKEVNNYVSKGVYELPKEKTFVKKLLERVPMLSFSFVFTKIFKMRPYFWFHFIFEKLYRSDFVFKRTWDDSLKLSANKPHRILEHGALKPISSKMKKEIDQKRSPVYKLNWRHSKKVIKGCAYQYLFDHVQLTQRGKKTVNSVP